MKKNLILLLSCIAFVSSGLFAQNCTPISFGAPIVGPPTEDLSCIERGQAYSETVYIQNFESVSVNAPLVGPIDVEVSFIRIDSIVNLPCGLNYQVNTSDSVNNNTIATGDSACISIYGTSYDFVGQYKLGIYLTVEINAPQPLGPQTFQGEATDLISQIESFADTTLPLDFKYWLRVIEPGASCPAIDTIDATAWNLTTSDPCPTQGSFLVQALSRESSICNGDSVELYATTAGGTGAKTFAWTPIASLLNANSQTSIAVPDSNTTYVVTATDASSATATDDTEISILPEPTAAFSFSVNNADVSFTNSSSDANSYAWDFGDGTSSSIMDPTKTYSDTGSYRVILTATNSCSSEKDTQTVTISSLAFCATSSACTPQSPTGNLGLSPVTDSVACINRGDFYQEYLFLEVPDEITIPGLGITATIDFLRINRIENLPCGISYRFDKPTQTYSGGATGCLEFSGTTIEQPGQYKLSLFITISVSVPAFGVSGEEFSGQADELLQQLEDQVGVNLGIDFEYWLRVKNLSASCPPLDKSGNNDLLASCPTYQIDFSGSSCDGATGILTASAVGGYPPYSIEWEDGNTDPDTLVGPNDVIVYLVTDSLDNVVCGEAQLLASTEPVADFGVTESGLSVSFTNSSSDGLSYVWDFGDGDSSTVAEPQHEFAAEGSYDVTLTVINDCGTDTYTESVTVEPAVGIADINDQFEMSIMPNPNTGLFYLNINTQKADNGVLSAYDMSGKVIYHSNVSLVNGRKMIDLSSVSPGVYVLELKTESTRKIEKLVIK